MGESMTNHIEIVRKRLVNPEFDHAEMNEAIASLAEIEKREDRYEDAIRFYARKCSEAFRLLEEVEIIKTAEVTIKKIGECKQ